MTPIDTTAGAFVAGLVTSLHCVGMCGPLACAWATGPKNAGGSFLRNTAAYHGAKLVSYVLVGAAAGAMGTLPLKGFQQGPGLLVPWLMVVMFAFVALGLERWIPKPLFLTRPMARVRGWAAHRSGFSRASLLGLATPLLPCGPLYLMFGLALANGSALRGAEFAAAFGLGTLPLLLLAQTQMRVLNVRLTPVQMQRLQRGLALCATLVMAWRLRGTFMDGSPLSCCH